MMIVQEVEGRSDGKQEGGRYEGEDRLGMESSPFLG